MRKFRSRGLYVITDCQRLDFPALYRITEDILVAGVPVLQYRDKSTEPKIRRERALSLQDLCKRHNTLFVVNDDVHLAQDIGAAGAHIGQDDMPFARARLMLGEPAIIGVSCYNRLELARTAQSQGADYIAFGAFFSTLTKKATVPAGLDLLRLAKSELTLPVVAIGGITPENGAALIQAGADLLAVASSIYGSDDPVRTVEKFNTLLL